MFDIGWTELLLIGVVALIVIGPKDLPVMFQTIGRFTGRMRIMAREFTSAMEQAAKDSGVKDAANDLKSLASPKKLGLDTMRDAADRFEKWDPLKPKAATPAPVVPTISPPVKPDTTPAAPEGPETAALRQQVEARREAARPVAADVTTDAGVTSPQKATSE